MSGGVGGNGVLDDTHIVLGGGGEGSRGGGGGYPKVNPMKHYHYCPKCHQSPPCEKPECALITGDFREQKCYSHHEVCAACEVMALAAAGGAENVQLTPEWFAVYNGFKR